MTNTSLDAYNIYDRKSDLRNDYGFNVEVNRDDYEPLRLSDFRAYLVNLTAIMDMRSLYSLDPTTESVLWSYETRATIYGGLSASYGCIYVGHWETAQEALSAIISGEDTSKLPPKEGLAQ
ncbi:hypothetical protein Tco_1232084 [Tanacetum coccineum]